jgi:predicted DNA-binding ArsR family transcriptional regulator
MVRKENKLNRKEIYALHNSGYTSEEIREAIGSKSARHIRRILQEADPQELAQTTKYVDTGKIKALHDAGWSVTGIAFEMCMTRKEIEEIIYGKENHTT